MQIHEKKNMSRMVEQRALRLLAQYVNRCSEWLCASALTAERYPELSESLEEMAKNEGRQFRALGKMMIREGVNPPLRRLMQMGYRGCSFLPSDREEHIRSFLRDMLLRGERMGQELEDLLLIFEWDREGAADMKRRKDTQLEIMKKMCS